MNWFDYLFCFKGRINRAKYWLFFLVAFVFEIIEIVLARPFLSIFWTIDADQPLDLGGLSVVEIVMLIAACIVGIVYMIAYFAVSVKRLHDRDLSAWWLLVFWLLPLALIPADSFITSDSGGDLSANVSVLVILGVSVWGLAEFFFLPGTRGPNRFGPDPLAAKATVAPPA